MPSVVCAALVAALACTSLLADAASGSSESDTRLAELRDLEQNHHGLALLDDFSFSRMVREKGRRYHTFVLFNAAGPAYKCSLCGPFEEEMKVLAQSYHRQLSSSSPASSSSSGRAAEESEGDEAAAEDESSLPIVFATIDISRGSSSQRTFNEYELRHAPILAYFPPKAQQSPTKLPPAGQYQGELNADAAAAFVREKTGFSITVYRSPWGKIAAVATLLASFVFAAWILRDKLGGIIDAVRGFLPLWLAVSLGFYFIGVSGVLYDVIRSPPFVGFDPKTRRTALVSGSGSQFVLEGLIVGFCYLICAASLIFLAKAAPKMRPAGGTRTFAFLAAGVTFLYCFTHVYSWYTRKTAWYSLSRLIVKALNPSMA